MKQLIDQSAHFFAAAGILAIATFLGASIGPASGAALGLAFGMIREITEDGSILTQNSLLDVLFWTMGGIFAGVLW